MKHVRAYVSAVLSIILIPPCTNVSDTVNLSDTHYLKAVISPPVCPLLIHLFSGVRWRSQHAGSHPWLSGEPITHVYICIEPSLKLLCEYDISAFLSKQGTHAWDTGTNKWAFKLSSFVDVPLASHTD